MAEPRMLAPMVKVVEPKVTAPVEDDTPAESFFFYGPPGSGKTTLAASLCNVVSPVILIDLDNKAKSMVNLKPYIDSGKLIVKSVKAELVEDKLYDRARSKVTRVRKTGGDFTTMGPPGKEPQGYLELCAMLDSLDRIITETNAQAVVVDPITTAYEHMYRLVSYITKAGTIEESAWSILLMNAEELLTAIMRCKVKYVIVTAHDRRVLDEDTGSLVAIMPEVPGQMRSKIIKYFSEAYHMEPRTGLDQRAVFQVRTQSTSYVQARTSRALEPIEPADLGVILDPEKRSAFYAAQAAKGGGKK